MGLFRQFCMWIDSAVFGVIEKAYNLIFDLAGIFVNNEIATSIIKNLYIIVGIFAFFKIAFLLVNSVIDPEKLNEKGRGLSNILVRTVGMLIILMFTPMLFEMAYTLQERIVGWETNSNGTKQASSSGNLIEKLILGESVKSSDDNTNAGKQFSNIALSTLVTVNETYAKDFVSIGDAGDGGTVGYNSNGTCETQACENAIQAWNDMYAKGDMNAKTLRHYINIKEKHEVSIGNNKEKEDQYVYNYTVVLTTVVGGFIAYILFSFALDIAARVFQLAALEIISPLFIVTFIDPKSASSGMFNRWLKEVGSTYVGLFIRLASVSLLILFTSILNKLKWLKSSSSSSWVNLTLMLGLLLFAKKAPKWISEMIGFKSDGLGGLGIGKKLASTALVGGAIGKGLGAAKKGIGNQAKKTLDHQKKKMQNAGNRALAGLATGREAWKDAREKGRNGTLTDANGNKINGKGIKGKGKTYSQMAKNAVLAASAARGKMKLEQLKNPENDFRIFKGVRDKYNEAAKAINPQYTTKGERKISEMNDKVQAQLVAAGMDNISIGGKIKDAKEMALTKALYGTTDVNKALRPTGGPDINNSYARVLNGKTATSEPEIHSAAYATLYDADSIDANGNVIKNDNIIATSDDVEKWVSKQNPYFRQLLATTAYENNIKFQNEYTSTCENLLKANQNYTQAVLQQQQFATNYPEPDTTEVKAHQDWEKARDAIKSNVESARDSYENCKEDKETLLGEFMSKIENKTFDTPPGDELGVVQIDGEYINQFGKFKPVTDKNNKITRYEFKEEDMSKYRDVISQNQDKKLSGPKYKEGLEQLKEQYSNEMKKLDNKQ